jgi:hypothetical protein
MSHKSNFEVPARLVFRPTLTNWVTCSAEILDWSEHDSVIDQRGGEMSTIAFDTKRQATGKYEKFHAVWVRIDLAGVKSVGAVAKDDASSSHHKILIYRKHLPPSVLQSWEKPNTQPDISGRGFTVLACPGRSLKESVSPTGLVKDAWAMRDEFLNLEQNTEALRQFLNKWGHLSGFRSAVGPESKVFDSIEFEIPHLIWKQQAEVRRALIGAPARWLRANWLHLTPTRTAPYFAVNAPDCNNAIEATITIDHLSRVKFGICKREDCRRLFERTSGQKRVYCCQPCAHLANVRAQRKEQKRLKLKEKGTKGNAKG